MKLPSFTVTAESNLTHLQSFLENNKGDNSRIYGEKKNGVVTLYLKPEAKTNAGRRLDKMAGGIANLVGLGNKRREAARNGIQTLTDRLRNAVEKTNKSLYHMIDTVQVMNMSGFNGQDHRANRRGQLLEMTKLVNEVVAKAEAPSQPKSVEQLTEETLESAGLGKDKETKFLQGKTLDISSKYPGHPIMGPIKLGDTIYNPERYVTAGGFGHVFEYKSEDKSQTIAFKVSIPHANSETKLKGEIALAKEVKQHQELTKKGPEGLVKMIGAVRLPGGMVGIATEFMSNGDMQGMSAKIRERIAEDENNLQPGQITRSEARVIWLSMLKDMALGMATIHESGASHFDFKTPNMLINKDGRGKVSDFGTVSMDQKIYLKDTEEIHSAAYKAPEHSLLLSEVKNIKNDISLIANRERDQLEERLGELLPGQKDILPGVVENIYSEREGKIEEQDNYQQLLMFNEPQKVDVWGFGASAIEMFTGAPFMGLEPGNQYNKEVHKESRLVDFIRAGTDHAIQSRNQDGTLGGMSISGGTGDVKIDRFLNWVLASRPEDRPTAEEILRHPIFSTPGVGSYEAYDYISLLGQHGDNPEIMDVARLNLAEEINK